MRRGVDGSRHTVARGTRVQVKPEDPEEAVRLFDDSVGPAARTRKRSWVRRCRREDDRALVVDACDTVEHIRRNERSGFYQPQVAKFASEPVDRPAREFFDVAVAEGVRGGPELLRSANGARAAEARADVSMHRPSSARGAGALRSGV